MTRFRRFGAGRLLVGCLAVCLGLPAAIGAHPFTAYQRNDDHDPALLQNIAAFSPIGQEFTAVLPCLEAVELYTADFDVGNSTGASLVVRIHQGTIFSPVVATSSVVALPDGFIGVTHFDFPSPVLLLPPLTYVIEISVLSGDAWAVGSAVASDSPVGLLIGIDSYPLGRQILFGMPVPTNDLWFREGASDPSGCVGP